MDHIINFLNNKQLTAGEIILTSVFSSLITLLLVYLFKSLIWKIAENFYAKCKFYVKKKYRLHKGRLTIKEIIELERKKNTGIPLTKKEEKILADCQEKMVEAIAKSGIKDMHIPNLPKMK